MGQRVSGRSSPIVLAIAALGFGCSDGAPSTLSSASPTRPPDEEPVEGRVAALQTRHQPTARVVASGIPGAGAVAMVHRFHPGSPIHDNPVFAAFTQPGHVFDPERVLVASTSNFGAPPWRPSDPPGSILSIDVSGSATLVVPPDFAAGGGQASALDGAVQLFAAQTQPFVNGNNNPNAVTAALPTVSLPTGISSNNGNGRPWFSNAPAGAAGDGTITVVDVTGIPLAGAPSATAGGVFAGSLTNATPSSRGLVAAAVATALLTRSPDGTGRAVFIAALADGSLAQVHVQKGVDALAPPGSFTALPEVSTARGESNGKHAVIRVGLAFNWVPGGSPGGAPIGLFLADPLGDRILDLDITDDGTRFVAGAGRYLSSPAFDVPVDLAPTSPEVASGNFSSGTTLGGGTDLYVLNRGNGTVVRIRQDGEIVALREISTDSALPGFRANGIAVSSDGLKIYVTGVGSRRRGYLLEMEAFGAGFVTRDLVRLATEAGATGIEALGADMFSRELSVRQRLGPLFNGRSCVACHADPAAGGASPLAASESRVAHIEDGVFDPLLGTGGPVARDHSIRELGARCRLPVGPPHQANALSPRHAMTLLGDGKIDDIQLKDIKAVQAAQPEAIRGTLPVLPGGRVGRFGWKADFATLVEFLGDAFRTEMGLTNPLAPRDLVSGCGANDVSPEIDALPVQAVAAFMNTLNPPEPSAGCLASPGAGLFSTTGCAGCHTPSIPSQGRPARLYSDLLLHDMGPGLADGFPEGAASGSQFRTMPLWRASDRARLLHDGRAASIEEAIGQHAGQATAARQAFDALDPTDRQAVLDFLGCI